MSTKFRELLFIIKNAGVKALAISTIIFFIPEFTGTTAAQTGEDSASVYKFVEAYQHTINTHDPVALAAFFTEDADLMMFNLPGVHGRQAIENWWRDVWQSKFNRQEPGRKGKIILKSVRFMADDVALANIETKTGGRDSMGVELHIRRARGTWLLHRRNGNWLISSIVGMPTERDSIELIRSLKASESLKPQIRAFVSTYEEAFNTHDPAAISAFYTNDADIVVRNSPLIHGRSAILKWWRAYFAQLRPQSLDRNRWFESMRTILIINKIRMINHNVALINITATAAARQTDTEPPPIRYARATWVIVREGSKWLIASLRVLPGEEDRIIRR
jgi:uncharacterized protein (TIGR02246 family)